MGERHLPLKVAWTGNTFMLVFFLVSDLIGCCLAY